MRLRSREATRRLGAAWVVTTVVLVAGCGVPPSDGAEPLDTEFSVVQPSVAPSTQASAATSTVEIAWVNERERLELVMRPVVAETRQGELDAAFDVLVNGPDEAELAMGLSTTLSNDVELEADLRGRRAVVDVIEPGSSSDLLLSVAQIAVTALAIPHVRTVVFVSNGEATSVPVPQGPNTERPLKQGDFMSLIG